jgi:hypothetical protein
MNETVSESLLKWHVSRLRRVFPLLRIFAYSIIIMDPIWEIEIGEQKKK